MAKKIKVLAAVLVFWTALFIAWEWWNSFPKVRIAPNAKVNSMQDGVDSILRESMLTYLLPGISAAVVKDGKVIYLNAFGFENLETKDSLTVDSKILVASISKLFIALGVASSFQDKEIRATDSLYSLKLDEIPNSSSLTNIQIDNLLLHQSGIRDKSFSEQILSFSKSQNLSEWGMGFVGDVTSYHSDSITYEYADSNYDLLGFLLSALDDFELDSIVKTHVFKPTEMINSEYVSDWPLEENGLTGYQKTFIWKRIEPKRIKFKILPSPSSGLVTTTKDMSIALIHLLNDQRGKFSKHLSWLTTDSEVPLGFQKIQVNGSDWVGHFGGQAGYSSLFFYSGEENTGIFLFSNSKDEEGFRTKIANQVLSYISP
ncbi:serine hydrolase domain-containing protein [Algoriphagus yeomjeoni]|uniref:serine hydrolase domain-containing protein n=1 Tax=Algoriphagus yeomjeoni TaxID=291403 RepID=UPI003CE48389